MNNFIIDNQTQKLIDLVNATKNQAIINKCYAQLVDTLVRQRYSQSKVEAIVNNYLDDSTNEKHLKEFQDLQSYRKECKGKAKELLNID